MSTTRFLQSALGRHGNLFTDDLGNFTPGTVSNGLEEIHSSQSWIKGEVISTFNATHSSSNIVCPVTGASFLPDEDTGFAKFLHLGTARIYKPDGSIDEERWDQFVNYISAGQTDTPIKVKYSRHMAYLLDCYNYDPQESNTGRNTNCMFSSKYIQGTAATQAWNEIYDRLTCGWEKMEDSDNLEPYITLDLIRLFYEDTRKALQKAKDGELPVKKPEIQPQESSYRTPQLTKLRPF